MFLLCNYQLSDMFRPYRAINRLYKIMLLDKVTCGIITRYLESQCNGALTRLHVVNLCYKYTHICSFSYISSDRVMLYLLYKRMFIAAFRCVIQLGTCSVASYCRYKQDRYRNQQCSNPLPISRYIHWPAYRISQLNATLFESQPGHRQSCLGYL